MLRGDAVHTVEASGVRGVRGVRGVWGVLRGLVCAKGRAEVPPMPPTTTGTRMQSHKMAEPPPPGVSALSLSLSLSVVPI